MEIYLISMYQRNLNGKAAPLHTSLARIVGSNPSAEFKDYLIRNNNNG